jgi:hypothetical protein
MQFQPIQDASAWSGRALHDDESWICRLTDGDLEEISTALASVQGRGLEAYRFEAEDFALPRLGPKLQDLMDEVQDGRGFVLLRGLPVERWDLETLKTVYWGLGVHLGEPVTQNLEGDLIAHITDYGLDVRAPNVKPSRTNAEQNPHCDPADVVSLLCVSPASEGGISHIASAATVYNEVLRSHPEYLPFLTRGFHHDLRGDHAQDSPHGVTPARIPVFSWRDGLLTCVFNADTIRDAQRKMGSELPREELEAVVFVAETARRVDLRLEMDFRPGDVQLLNNHTILHWRTGYRDDPQHKRLLLRLWMDSRRRRPRDPAVARGYITGARTGVASWRSTEPRASRDGSRSGPTTPP